MRQKQRTRLHPCAAAKAPAPPTAAPAARRFPTSLRTFTLYHFPRPGVHPAAPFFVHRFCAPAGAPFLKGLHKFALWNDTIALRLKKTGRAASFARSFPHKRCGKNSARRARPCAAAKAPRRAPICGRLLEKNKRGKTPRPNSWTEASAPAANRAERERRRKGAQSAAPRRSAAFRWRRAQIGWRSKKRLCYALFCPSAFFVKHSANFLKNAKGHHKFICANDNITLPGRKSRSCTAYSF